MNGKREAPTHGAQHDAQAEVLMSRSEVSEAEDQERHDLPMRAADSGPPHGTAIAACSLQSLFEPVL